MIKVLIAGIIMLIGAVWYAYLWNQPRDIWDGNRYWTQKQWKVILKKGNSYDFLSKKK